MAQLPDRPDLDQLRRQARELHRAAEGGDPGALRRLRAVSDKVTLSTAQLALAREYGFSSWRLLRDEAVRRRTLFQGPEREAARLVPAPPPAWSWREDPEWSDGLVDAQYADRPQLRPVLDAVLVAATASTLAGRSCAVVATTAIRAWPGATYRATARCGCSAGPSSASSMWERA